MSQPWIPRGIAYLSLRRSPLNRNSPRNTSAKYYDTTPLQDAPAAVGPRTLRISVMFVNDECRTSLRLPALTRHAVCIFDPHRLILVPTGTHIYNERGSSNGDDEMRSSFLHMPCRWKKVL